MKKQAINERIHKGFRAWLLELGIRTAKTDFTRMDEGRKTAVKLQELISAWEHKFLLESGLFFPALALKAPYSVALLDEEKRTVESKCRQVSRIIQQYIQPGLPAHYVSTGKALLEAFSSLASCLVGYMNLQDELFRTATKSSEDSEWNLCDVDAFLVHESQNQIQPGSYQMLVRMNGMSVHESGICLARQVHQKVGEKQGLFPLPEHSSGKRFYRIEQSPAF